jgi:hypothetical protein
MAVFYPQSGLSMRLRPGEMEVLSTLALELEVVRGLQ